MKLIPYFLILFFFISCNMAKYKNIIAPNSGKNWDVIKDGKRVYNKPAYCYYFGSDGSCFYYNYRIENGKLKKKLFDYGDVVYPNNWELKSDTLVIQGFNYLIKEINDANIIVVSLNKSADTLRLTPSVLGL